MTDWSLSDLSDEQAERIAGVLDNWASTFARWTNYDGATDLATAAMIVRDWLDRRYDREPAPGDLAATLRDILTPEKP